MRGGIEVEVVCSRSVGRLCYYSRSLEHAPCQEIACGYTRTRTHALAHARTCTHARPHARMHTGTRTLTRTLASMCTRMPVHTSLCAYARLYCNEHCAFQNSSLDLYRRLWENSVQYQDRSVSTTAEGMARVLREDYIFLDEISSMAHIVFNDCRYAFAKHDFSPDYFAFVFPKNSPYLPAVNKR